jgi:hypothetical protein
VGALFDAPDVAKILLVELVVSVPEDNWQITFSHSVKLIL